MGIKSKLSKVCVFTGSMFFATVIHASLINWTYTGALSTSGADTLGIAGETLSLTVIFDDSDVWQGFGSDLVIAGVSAYASVSGGHSVSVKSAIPAAFHVTSSGIAFISESVSTGSFVDFIIDGDTTMTFGSGNSGTPPQIPTLLQPVLGENLLIGHLSDDINMLNSITSSDFSGAYILSNETISITSVPVPAAAWLFGSGLIGLIGLVRRKA